jgi:hypothetical protein
MVLLWASLCHRCCTVHKNEIGDGLASIVDVMNGEIGLVAWVVQTFMTLRLRLLHRRPRNCRVVGCQAGGDVTL